MPDEVITKTIPELSAGAIIQGSLFENAQPNVQASTGYNSVKVTADDVSNYVATTKTYSQLQTTSKTIVSAINEAAQSGGGGASVIQKTLAEYQALPQSSKMNGSIYKITDKALIYCLDEEYHAYKELTSIQYQALTSDEKNNGTLYIITDEETTAADIPVSDSDSTSIAEAISGVSAVSRYSATGSVYGSFSFKEINNIKFVLMRNLTGLAANALTTLDFTLPENFRPIEDVCYFDVRQPSSDYTVRLILNPSGVVQIYNYGSTTGALNVSFIGSYI